MPSMCGHTTKSSPAYPEPRARLPRFGLLVFLAAVVAYCGSLAAKLPASRMPAAQLASTAGQNYYADAHSYLEDPLERLTTAIPELKDMQPAEDQQLLPKILSETGQRVQAFFDGIVNVMADEEIQQQKLNGKGKPTGSRHLRYSYLIVTHRDELPARVEEYRTDSSGNNAEPEGLAGGYAVTTGFALKSIHFLPELRSDSTFRYLGNQRLGKSDTYVVAFAQRPGRATVTSHASGDWGTVILLLQGIAWVDQSNFQIVRLRTDLLLPRRDVGLEKQTAEVNFGEVLLQGVADPLWLPSDATVYSEFRGQNFLNAHHYTNYKLFRSSVRIVAP